MHAIRKPESNVLCNHTMDPLAAPISSITIATLLNLAINVKPRSAFQKPKRPGKSGLSVTAAVVPESPWPRAVCPVQSQMENVSCWNWSYYTEAAFTFCQITHPVDLRLRAPELMSWCAGRCRRSETEIKTLLSGALMPPAWPILDSTWDTSCTAFLPLCHVNGFQGVW